MALSPPAPAYEPGGLPALQLASSAVCMLLSMHAALCPQAAEHIEVERLQRAALTIQRAWRLYCVRKAIKCEGGSRGGVWHPFV